MGKTIYDDSFISKLLNGKYKTKVATRECDLEKLFFKQKIEFTIARLSCMLYDEARLIIHFWESKDHIINILKKYSIRNYILKRNYNGLYTPGVLSVFFHKGEFNECFLKDIITKHYGFELAKEGSLNIMLYYSVATSKEITIVHLYDDRGFKEFSYIF